MRGAEAPASGTKQQVAIGHSRRLTVVQGIATKIEKDVLEPGDIEHLRSLRPKLKVEVQSDSVTIYTREWAGTVQLRSLRIEVRPKIHPSRWRDTFFYLLKSVGRDLNHMGRQTSYGKSNDAFEKLISLFLDETELLLAQGLRRDYTLEERRQRYIRGKVVLRDMVTPRWDGTLKCRFYELSPDSPENQLLRAALEVVPRLPLSIPVASRGERLLASFADVRPALPQRIPYNRLNERYQEAHRLARVVLKHSFPAFSEGRVPFWSFFVNMEVLFQDYLAHLIRGGFTDGFKVSAPARGRVEGHFDNRIRSITLEPDVLVSDARTGKPLIVLDAKYKVPTRVNRFGFERARNSDFYQIFTYASKYECPGVLVYPQHDFSNTRLREHFQTPNQSTALYTVDLAQEPHAMGRTLVSDLHKLLRREANARE